VDHRHREYDRQDRGPTRTLEFDANTTCILDNHIYKGKTVDLIYQVLHNIVDRQFQSINNKETSEKIEYMSRFGMEFSRVATKKEQ
jgi:hypothetical protein